jgi:hypothetical protein
MKKKGKKDQQYHGMKKKDKKDWQWSTKHYQFHYNLKKYLMLKCLKVTLKDKEKKPF